MKNNKRAVEILTVDGWKNLEQGMIQIRSNDKFRLVEPPEEGSTEPNYVKDNLGNTVFIAESEPYLNSNNVLTVKCESLHSIELKDKR